MSRQITLLHGGSLGDFLLSLGLLRRVAASEAPSQSTVVARRPMSAIPARGLGLDTLLDADQGGLHRLFTPDEPLSGELADCLSRSDLVIDMLLHGHAEAPRRLATTTPAKIVSVDPRPVPGCTDHAVDQWARAVRAHGIEVAPAETTGMALRFDGGSRERARHELIERCQPAKVVTDEPLAMLHPGSGGRRKCWPIERFVELAECLLGDGVRPLFLLGPTELDWHGADWPERLRSRGPVVVEADLWRLACLIHGADLYVGNDAGSTHLAAATGTPTLALFGPTDVRVWRPLGPAVHVLAPDGPPTPDMGWLSVHDVHLVCTALLARSVSQRA